MIGLSMAGGFRVFLGIVAAVVLVYSALSVWPVLTSPLPTGNSGFRTRSGAPAFSGSQPALQPQPALPPVTTPPRHTPGMPAPPPQPAASLSPAEPPASARRQDNPRLDRELLDGLIPDEQPVMRAEDWVYASRSFFLLTEPGGNAHRAYSLCNAELELLSGTRLRQIRAEQDWVLVKSPGNIIGWAHRKDLTDKAPPTTERKWSLRPSGS
jgi:hypothetical protein